MSFFTNILQDLAIEWMNINRKKTHIPKNDFIGAIKLILLSTYFTFNGKIYRQTFGSPMSSPIFDYRELSIAGS